MATGEGEGGCERARERCSWLTDQVAVKMESFVGNAQGAARQDVEQILGARRPSGSEVRLACIVRTGRRVAGAEINGALFYFFLRRVCTDSLTWVRLCARILFRSRRWRLLRDGSNRRSARDAFSPNSLPPTRPIPAPARMYSAFVPSPSTPTSRNRRRKGWTSTTRKRRRLPSADSPKSRERSSRRWPSKPSTFLLLSSPRPNLPQPVSPSKTVSPSKIGPPLPRPLVRRPNFNFDKATRRSLSPSTSLIAIFSLSKRTRRRGDFTGLRRRAVFRRSSCLLRYFVSSHTSDPEANAYSLCSWTHKLSASDSLGWRRCEEELDLGLFSLPERKRLAIDLLPLRRLGRLRITVDCIESSSPSLSPQPCSRELPRSTVK